MLHRHRSRCCCGLCHTNGLEDNGGGNLHLASLFVCVRVCVCACVCVCVCVFLKSKKAKKGDIVGTKDQRFTFLSHFLQLYSIRYLPQLQHPVLCALGHLMKGYVKLLNWKGSPPKKRE